MSAAFKRKCNGVFNAENADHTDDKISVFIAENAHHTDQQNINENAKLRCFKGHS